TGHFGNLLVYLSSLNLELLRRLRRQLQRQFPGKETQTLGLFFEGLVQALLTILLLGDARCLSRKGIEVFEFVLKLRISREESGQGDLVWMFGLSHAGSKETNEDQFRAQL